MDINILEESKKRMVFEIIGESHGFCNILRDALWQTKKVKAAGYNISHPLTGTPKIIIEAESGDTRSILKDALKKLDKDCTTFTKEFKKAK